MVDEVNESHSTCFFTLFPFFCTPRKFLVEIYSSDFDAANQGEITQIPVTIEFSFMVKDKDEMIELAKKKTLPFLSKDSSMELSKATFGKTLTIKTKFPLGEKSVLEEKELPTRFFTSLPKMIECLSSPLIPWRS